MVFLQHHSHLCVQEVKSEKKQEEEDYESEEEESEEEELEVEESDIESDAESERVRMESNFCFHLVP